VIEEIEKLKALLKEDWTEIEHTGEFKNVDRIDGEDRRWTRTVEVITRGPSGQHYRWEYEHGLTEIQEDMGPGEYYELKIVPVRRVVELVETVKWVTE
jgi:hypothetical protein